MKLLAMMGLFFDLVGVVILGIGEVMKGAALSQILLRTLSRGSCPGLWRDYAARA
jgi:hypothetical protein